MSVHQRKDGRWFVKWPNKEPPPSHHYRYFGFGLNAERKARDFNQGLNLRPWKRRTPPKMSPTFAELVNGYIESKIGTVADTTIDNFYWKMVGVILPEIGDTQAIRLTAHRMDQYVVKRLKKVKKTTIHRELSDIQAVLNWSVKRGYLDRNPIAGYEKPQRDDAIIMPPTQEEVDLIIKHAPEHLRRSIMLAYLTGLRPGNAELFNLSWDDVQLDEGVILIRSAKKGGLRYRMVPIHDEFAGVLRQWKESDKGIPWVVHYKGRQVKSLKRSWATAKKEAGIARRLRLYDLRHAAITSMLRAGGDLKSVSELAGHTRTDTTTRIYQHTDTDMHREIINRLPPLQHLKGGTKKRKET